jgi:pyruvate dehydrogenase E2 component (dihydrolipoamide acetyltransferase)
MAKVLEMPKLSPTMEEGQISAWHKNEGDSVDVDDLLAEVETDKATMEFRSFDRGTLLKILAPAGSVISLGQPVAILGQPGEDISGLVGAAPQAPAAAPPAAAPDASASPAAPSRASSPAAPEPTPTTPAPPAGRVKASPYVRKLARERDLDLSGLSGSGPAGRIVARDLEGMTAPPRSAAPTVRVATADLGNREPERRPLSMMRKTIARRLTESKQNVPHFYLTIDVDAGRLVELREALNRDLATADWGDGSAPKVSYNDLLIKACALGLRRVPECNAQFMGDHLLVHRKVDISVAVAIPDGLVTPVVRDADRRTVLEIAAEVRDLAGRARQKKLAPEEMVDGTFSISNLGMFGIDEFSAVINPPEGAILAVGQVRREPVVVGEAVVPGHRMGMTLSCATAAPSWKSRPRYAISPAALDKRSAPEEMVDAPSPSRISGCSRRVLRGDQPARGGDPRGRTSEARACGLGEASSQDITLSCDHRAIDGAVGASFLKVLRNLVEHPALSPSDETLGRESRGYRDQASDFSNETPDPGLKPAACSLQPRVFRPKGETRV